MTYALRRKGFYSIQRARSFAVWMNQKFPSCGAEVRNGSYYDDFPYFVEWESPDRYDAR